MTIGVGMWGGGDGVPANYFFIEIILQHARFQVDKFKPYLFQGYRDLFVILSLRLVLVQNAYRSFTTL